MVKNLREAAMFQSYTKILIAGYVVITHEGQESGCMSAERLEHVKRTASIIDDVTQKLESTVKPINSWNSEHRHQVSNKRYRYVGLI